MDYSGFYLSSYAHRDYGIGIVPMYYIVFTIHRDTGKCRRPDVCCRQAQIYKQCCFATLTNNKSHALASELAGMAFIIRDHYVVTVYISEFGSLSLIFHGCWWFWGVVEQDAVDAWYFCDDAVYQVVD